MWHAQQSCIDCLTGLVRIVFSSIAGVFGSRVWRVGGSGAVQNGCLMSSEDVFISFVFPPFAVTKPSHKVTVRFIVCSNPYRVCLQAA